ncbi:MAG: hypothetical protein KME13_06500 [Myxacorys californica WJT36-NPBG1]|jgi:hypothetical protein|nr:hypothetical protein [Myxacorys californica WJT36-NPBG1]
MTEAIACTIITKSHLAYARTLAETLAEHQPEIKLYVLLADRVDQYFDPVLEPFELIQLEDLADQPTIQKMCFYYTPFELCCALRGALHEYIFEKTSALSWLFFDSDIMICHSLETLFQELSSVSLLLSPHCRCPVDLQNVVPHETNFLRSGLSNAGFLGLRRTKETHRFIQWFKERLTYYCFNDQGLGDPRGLFVDQLWLNLALLYFQDRTFVQHAGANIGHWNLWEKTLDLNESGKVVVDQEPLLFVHFSGWNIAEPERISVYSPMYQGRADELWIKLAEGYREKLLKNGYELTKEYPYAFKTFCNGEKITASMRRDFYEQLAQGRLVGESPFERPDYFQTSDFTLRNVTSLESALKQAIEQIEVFEATTQQMSLQLHHTQAEFEHSQQQLHHTQAEFEHSQQQLHHTQAEFEHSQQQLHHTQAKVSDLHEQVQRLHEHVQAMESTKFWKLRAFWLRVKQVLWGM